MLAAHIEGFVDLEDHTPADQKNVLADHGMVVLFQPFTGNWTRILGVFASKGNVKSVTLAKTIVETAVLAEKAGLFVDCITCDGASWNRSMWRLLGIQAGAGIERLAVAGDVALQVLHQHLLARERALAEWATHGLVVPLQLGLSGGCDTLWDRICPPNPSSTSVQCCNILVFPS
ncbi:hypothetical protein HPB49_025727 [Dermacentor silvarum]|nr:hypothetical protein HPB49_025727 [Dermacentor silvarum]